MNQGRNFFKPILAPMGRVRSLNSIHFHMKIRFYWYLRRVMSLMLDRVGRGSKVGVVKKGLRLKKCPSTQKNTQWSVKIRLPVTQWWLPSFFKFENSRKVMEISKTNFQKKICHIHDELNNKTSDYKFHPTRN